MLSGYEGSASRCDRQGEAKVRFQLSALHVVNRTSVTSMEFLTKEFIRPAEEEPHPLKSAWCRWLQAVLKTLEAVRCQLEKVGVALEH